MRTKPLNPNSMAVIMENFRRYVDENADEETTERIYLLREGKEPVETTLSTLMEKRDRGELNMVEMVDLMNESMQHEFKQIMAEHDQLILAEQEEEGEEEDRHGLGASAKAAEEKGGGLKWKLRKKVLTFMYSKVAAYIKGTFGQEKAAITPMGANLQKGAQAAKAGNAKEAVKLLGMEAYKASLKGIKFLFKAMLKVVQGVAWLVGKLASALGTFFKHPVIRVIMIAVLVLMMAQAVGTTAIMYSGWKVANQVTGLVTGKTATGHAVGAAAKGVAKGAKAAGKKALGLQEDVDSMSIFTGNVVGPEGLEGIEGMTWAEALGDVDATTLGAAIIKLASQLEGQEVLEFTQSDEIQAVGPDGNTIVWEHYGWDSADVALTKEMGAISMMKAALQSIAAAGEGATAGDLDFHGEVFKETGEAMQGAIAAAKAACENDPAHCAGADQLAKSIDEIWSGHVQSEITDSMQEYERTGEGAIQFTKKILQQHGNQAGVKQVVGGAEAAAKLGAAGIEEKLS